MTARLVGVDELRRRAAAATREAVKMEAQSIVKRFVDACWNHSDPAAARALCRPSIADSHLGFAERVRAAGPDVLVTIDVITEDGHGWVGTLQTRTQTHTGVATGPLVDQLIEGSGIQPTGRTLESQSAVFYRIEDGIIVELVSIADNLRFFAQFGSLRLDCTRPPTERSTARNVEGKHFQ